ncbi:hypothetical protein ACMBCN_01120 [Candidatus Liberibacter asiaticus]
MSTVRSSGISHKLSFLKIQIQNQTLSDPFFNPSKKALFFFFFFFFFFFCSSKFISHFSYAYLVGNLSSCESLKSFPSPFHYIEAKLVVNFESSTPFGFKEIKLKF